MINISEFRTNLLDSINKWRSGSIPPGRQDNFIQQASIELLNEKYLAQIQTQKLDDDISIFHKSVNLPVTVPEGLNYGLIQFPTDYIYYWTLRAFFSGTIDNLNSCGCPTADNSACNAQTNLIQTPVPIELIPIVKEVNVEKVDSGRWSAVLNHRTKAPTLNHPYCTEYEGGFKVAPRNLSIVTMDYYVLPVKAKFGYQIIQNNVTAVPFYQYDPNTSTNIQWGSQVQNELLDRVMKLCAIYLNNPNLYSAANELKATRV
jgi:hypothetical protein